MVDDRGNTGGPALTDTASISVTVADTTAPTIIVPSIPVTVEADPGEDGAVVTYAVDVTDRGTAAPPVACTPASGSFFPIGDTIVSCTATDPSGNVAAMSFSVTIKGGQLPDTGGGGLPVLPWALALVILGNALLLGALRRRS